LLSWWYVWECVLKVDFFIWGQLRHKCINTLFNTTNRSSGKSARLAGILFSARN
jgi:hypothetical protein